jgi:nitrite reductase (cytochrome c-552)
MKRLPIVLIAAALLTFACHDPRPARPVDKKTADRGIDPENWGKEFPIEYGMWKKTADPKAPGFSKYKRGWDSDLVVYDKLSEFPYMGVLFAGWGFGVEYNEPRGHEYMVIDQLEIDKSRLKAGGVCLTCKSPYATTLKNELGPDYFSKPYMEVHAKIPEKHRKLGVACSDCHNPDTMQTRIERWTLVDALARIKKDPSSLTRQEMRSAVCAQCHVTYIIPKDTEMRSTGVFFPWDGGKWGDISIEGMIGVIRSSPANREWKQKTTGMKMGFIRHPEFEFYARGSVHWNAEASCADCHMPEREFGKQKASDHDVTSPLKNGLRGCARCHSEEPARLKSMVLEIQEKTLSLLLKAGYKTARAAKMIEKLNETVQAGGKALQPDAWRKIADAYEDAFYRVTYMGAENSVGFHNPAEGVRILGDATAFAGEAENLLAAQLKERGVDVDAFKVDVASMLNGRGEKKLNFKPEQEFKDPATK